MNKYLFRVIFLVSILFILLVVALILLLVYIFIVPTNNLKVADKQIAPIYKLERIHHFDSSLTIVSSNNVFAEPKEYYRGKLDHSLLLDFFKNYKNGYDSNEKFNVFYKKFLISHYNGPWFHKLGNGFNLIFEKLDEKNKNEYIIIEVGTSKIPPNINFLDFDQDKSATEIIGNAVKDRIIGNLPIIKQLKYKNNSNIPINPKEGNSTLLFDAYINWNNGKFYSCDISEEICENASKFTSSKTKIYLDDSVKFLSYMDRKTLNKADLIYLDSIGYKLSNHFNNSLQHLFELTSIFRHLKSGCLIAITGNPKWPTKKVQGSSLIKKFFKEHFGLSPIIDSYIVVFELP